MKRLNRWLAMVLALLMVCSSVFTDVAAAEFNDAADSEIETEAEEYEDADDESWLPEEFLEQQWDIIDDEDLVIFDDETEEDVEAEVEDTEAETETEAAETEAEVEETEAEVEETEAEVEETEAEVEETEAEVEETEAEVEETETEVEETEIEAEEAEETDEADEAVVEPLSPAFSCETKIDGIVVKVSAEAGILPDGVTCTVKKYDRIDGTLSEAIVKKQLEAGKMLTKIVTFKVTFKADGKTVQPKNGSVTISTSMTADMLSIIKNIPDSCVRVYQISDNEASSVVSTVKGSDVQATASEGAYYSVAVVADAIVSNDVASVNKTHTFEKAMGYGEDRLILETASAADASYIIPNLPPTRDQNPYGTCWTFSSMACAETSMNKVKGYSSSRDYSELQLAYSTYHTKIDPLGGITNDTVTGDTSAFLDYGGRDELASNTLSAWQGAVNESTIPYSMASSVASSNSLSASLIKKATARVRDYFWVDPTTDRQTVKEYLLKYGAVSVSYGAYSDFYSGTYDSWYSPYSYGANHAVAVVGWDDNYNKNNFWTAAPANGAWLIRNSWQAGEGSASRTMFTYFWLSYYDQTLDTIAVAYRYQPASTYDHNYQYDGGIWMEDVTRTSAEAKYTKAANVFKVKANEAGETLKAVSFYSDSADVNYRIQVYKNVTGTTNPTNGTLVSEATTKGTVVYPGFHTIKLDSPVKLDYGTKFSVVVSVSKDGAPAQIGCESNVNIYGVNATFNYNIKAGQSFLQSSSGNWSDLYNEYYGNLKIKAFTVDAPSATYTVKFLANGATGGSMSSKSMTTDVSYNLPANAFTWKRHIFTGWNTKADGSGKSYKNKASVKNLATTEGAVVKLYAQWTTYAKITYKLNGGTNNSKNVSEFKMSSTGSVTLYAPKKKGYIFKGWYLQKDFSGTKQTSLSKNVSKNYTVYAKWAPITYYIVFYPNGGTGSSYKQTGLKYGTSYTLKANQFTKSGYIFDGWNGKKDGTGASYENKGSVKNLKSTDGSHKNLYAQWTKTCRVTYVLNGGKNNSNNVASFKVASTGTVKLYNPTRSGYEFAGWYTDANFTNKVTSLKKNTKKHYTVYAKWTRKAYSVEFKANGGSGSMFTISGLKYGTSYTLPENTFTRNGYTFIGWSKTKYNKDLVYKNCGNMKKTSTIESGVVTLYACWTKNENSAMIAPTDPIIYATSGETSMKWISYYSNNGYDGDLKIKIITPDIISEAHPDSYWGQFYSYDEAHLRRDVNYTLTGKTGKGLMKITNDKNDNAMWLLVIVTADTSSSAPSTVLDTSKMTKEELIMLESGIIPEGY